MSRTNQNWWLNSYHPDEDEDDEEEEDITEVRVRSPSLIDLTNDEQSSPSPPTTSFEMNSGPLNSSTSNVNEMRARLGPGFLTFLHKFIKMLLLWIVYLFRDDLDELVFYQMQILDFINGRIDVEQFLRNLQVDQIPSLAYLNIILQTPFEIWQETRGDQVVNIEEFFQMTPIIDSMPPIPELSSPQTSASQTQPIEINQNQSNDDEAFQDINETNMDLSQFQSAMFGINPIGNEQDDQNGIDEYQPENVIMNAHQFNEENEDNMYPTNSFIESLAYSVCPVCLESMRKFAQQEIKIPMCGHIMCAKCFQRLVENKCPVCRELLPQNATTIYPSFA